MTLLVYNITLDELLKNDIEFSWSMYCHKSFEFLKRNLVEASALRFPKYLKKLPLHVVVYYIVVGFSLAQLGRITLTTQIVF
jgi:hypothetical protein